jgi:Family of unknown function (DUF6788)
MATPKPLQELQREHRRLLREILSLGPVLKGSVSPTYTTCGKPNCHCQDHPPRLHGPYWRWSTSVDGKTLSRKLDEEERLLYQQWVGNRKRLETLIQQMHQLALDAATRLRTNASAN